MLQQQYYAPLNKHKHSLLTIFSLDFTISTLVSNAVFNFLSSPYTSYRIHLLKHPKTPPISIFKYFSQVNLRSFIVNTEFIPSLGFYYAVKELIRVGRNRGGRGEGKNIEKRKIDVMWTVNNFVNGGLAGFITTLVTYPIQIPLPVILSRSLQWNTPSTPRLTRLKKPLYLLRKSKDILYRGFFLSSISITLSRSILYGFFDTFKIFFERDFVSQTVLGGYGAFFGTLVSYPFVTVIRNRIMKKERVRSNYESWKMIVEEEGWKGLYRGVRREGVKAVFAGVVLAGIEWGQFVVYPRFNIE